MLKPTLVKAAPKPSHKENKSAAVHKAETFATSAITTITNESAYSFNFGRFKILFSCWRTFDKVRIQKVFPKDRMPGFSNTVDVEAMGLQIYCNEATCSLYPLEDQDLTPGQTYHHFLLKHGEREMMASISVDIRPITKPTATKYTRDVQFSAAFAAFEAKCRQAQSELRDEIERLLDVHTDRIYADIQTQTPPVAAPQPPITASFRISPRTIARKAGVRIGAS